MLGQTLSVRGKGVCEVNTKDKELIQKLLKFVCWMNMIVGRDWISLLSFFLSFFLELYFYLHLI